MHGNGLKNHTFCGGSSFIHDSLYAKLLISSEQCSTINTLNGFVYVHFCFAFLFAFELDKYGIRHCIQYTKILPAHLKEQKKICRLIAVYSNECNLKITIESVNSILIISQYYANDQCISQCFVSSHSSNAKRNKAFKILDKFPTIIRTLSFYHFWAFLANERFQNISNSIDCH